MRKSNTEPDSQSATVAPGVLYVLATPIGNLEDITIRALRVLREVDVIACEDTRQTQKLLNHFDIAAKTVSYHEHNEAARAPELLAQLAQGARVALVSDAGVPCISDPGFRLVRLCVEHQIKVVPIPGASAVMTALAAAGLPTHAFYFAGFLPPKEAARRKALEALSSVPGTLVLFESPHRIVELLAAVERILGDRPVVVARELTKLHEEFLRGRCSEVRSNLKSREKILGELTVLIGERESDDEAARAARPLSERVEELINVDGLSRMDALKRAARERGISKSQAWREYESSTRS